MIQALTHRVSAFTGVRTFATAKGDEEECSTAGPQADQAGPRLIASRRQTLALVGASVIALQGNKAAADDSAPLSAQQGWHSCHSTTGLVAINIIGAQVAI